jgi:segregation and condensation protein B
MSLKAKIEAVIYASEEPVTLSQLTGLLGQEAQAELDHLNAAQQSLPLDLDLGLDPASGSDPASASEEITAPLLPEVDLEGAQPSAESTGPELTEPAPTEQAPTTEPEPTDSSPIPEHPASPDAAPAETAPPSTQKSDDKNRERKLREYFRSILDELIADYSTSARGLEIREVAGGYRLATKPEYHDAVRGFVKSLKPPLKLSLQALETLAVIAYKQPVTAPEISEIRGVDSGGVLGSLMARKLITTAGRKQVIGRPILYKTTRDFLLRFGLKDVSELPSIEEFEKMAGELADIEPVQEEIPMPNESAEISRPASDTTEPEADGTAIPLEGSDESSAGSPGNTVATPEGDNEFAPDQPIEPIAHGHQKPPAIDTNNL